MLMRTPLEMITGALPAVGRRRPTFLCSGPCPRWRKRWPSLEGTIAAAPTAKPGDAVPTRPVVGRKTNAWAQMSQNDF